MAASVVASVALPISNNFSFAPSMDAYGKLSEYGKLGAWSPLSLFAASEVGAWYDPSDLSTMFQDAAGTTPVTADGQPVGKILDKSGRGNHATQATAASRPLYKTDGTYHWLQFDGVDDWLSTSAINFTATDKMSVFSGIKKNSDTGGMIVELSLTVDSNAGSFAHAAGNVVGGYYGALARGTAAISGTQASTSVAYVAPDIAVLSSLHDIPVDNTTMRHNGVAFSAGVGDKGAGNFGNYPLYIGRRGGSLYPLNGNLYSLIVRGALSTPQEITDTETWVNSKTGAY